MTYHDKNGPPVSQGAKRALDNTTADQFASADDRAEPLFELVRAGYDLILLHGPDELNAKGDSLGKVPLHRGWTRETPATPAAAAAHLAEGRNVGVRLGETQVVVDWDPRNDPDGTSLDRLCARFGLDTHPRVVTGSGGVHLYLQIPAGNYRWRLDGFPGVDVKGRGGFVVAPGSVHPVTRERYRLELDPIDDALFREAPAELVAALTRVVCAEATGGGEIGPERLSEMLSVLDPKKYRDHVEWLAIMMAAHHATAGAGRDEFVAWSISDPDYADDRWIIERRWDSLRADNEGDRVTIGTLYKAVAASGNAHLLPADFDAAADDFAEVEAEKPAGALEKRPESWMAEYDAKFATAIEGGRFRVFMDTATPRHDGKPRRYYARLTQSDFLAHVQNETFVDQHGKVRKKGLGWLESKDRRSKFEGVVFDPRQVGPVAGNFNLWRGWGVSPAPGDWSLTRRLIDEALASGNADHADYIIRWLAFAVQHPAVLPEVALVFQGDKGVGKGTLGRVMLDFAGSHGMTVASAAQFSGRFNAHLRELVYLFADEVMHSGDKTAEGVLKQLITEPEITYEGKGKDSVTGANYCKLVMASNEDWVVPASLGERRFAVFKVPPVFKGNDAFFAALNRQLATGGREAMLHDLLRVDLSGWHPRSHVPQTEALAEQKLLGMSPFERWWFEMLDAGRLASGADWPRGDAVLIGAGSDKDGLVDMLNLGLKRDARPFTKRTVATELKRMGVDIHAHDKKGNKAWAIPALPVARERFSAISGISFD